MGLMKKAADIAFIHPKSALSRPDNASLKGEEIKEKPVEQSIVPTQPTVVDDPLGDSFEQLPQDGGRPRERGLLPKGVQPVEGIEDNDESVLAAVAVTEHEMDEIEPSYEEARMRSDWLEWRKAIDVELDNLKSAGTWDVVERPANVNVVDSKWVFRLKKDAKSKE